MAIEGYDSGGDLAIPQANAAILVADSEDIGIGFALGDGSYLRQTILIPPPT